MVPQAGPHPAFHHLYPHFDLGLSSGLGRPGRDHGEAIVLCEVRVGPIDLGFIAMRPGDGRFEVIGDDDLGEPPSAAKVRTCEPIQSGRLWLQVASA